MQFSSFEIGVGRKKDQDKILKTLLCKALIGYKVY